MDKFRIDSHKLMFHQDRVLQWSNGADIYPIYIEIAPSGACNHRCKFCALDYLGYRPDYLETQRTKRFLSEIASKGIKSIMFAGEGEPLLHKDIVSLVESARKNGLDVAMTTNGTLLDKALAQKIIPYLSWLRVSLNAGTPKTYSSIHGTHADDFKRAIENTKEAVRLRNKNKYACTIGVQMLLLKENCNEASKLAAILKQGKVDYLIVKPYSQHPLSLNRLKSQLDYRSLLSLEKELVKFDSDDFHIVFRSNTMLKISEYRPYRKCLGMPFWAYLSSKGDLYACSAFLGDERFSYGNIYGDSFEKLWKGKKRKKVVKMMERDWNIKDCREVCRLDEINRYLWSLKNPPAHLNFI